MKRRIVAAMLAGMMVFGVAGSSMAAENSSTEKITEAESEISTEEEAHPLFEELSAQQFVFSSGAGAWGTMLYVNSEGAFSGEFHDSEMGMTGEGYSHGTIYQSKFSGKFTETVQINDYTWSMQIEEIAFEKEVGTEEIKDEILYSYTTPYGLEGGEEFLLYLPGAPLEELPEEYLSWVGYYDLTQTEDTELPFYGIYNVTEQSGFSSYNLIDSTKEMLGYAEETAAALKESLEKDSLNQMVLNEKTSYLYKTWDEALNHIWGVLQKILPEEEMKALTEEELAWIEDKEQAVKEAGAEFAGGSMQAMIMNGEAASWTEERVYVLMEILEAGSINKEE